MVRKKKKESAAKQRREHDSLPDRLRQADRQQDSDSFEFVQERIKERPINKKKLLRRTVITASMALLFGLVACVTFFWLEPIISNWLYPEEEPELVTFPEEEVETMPEDMIQTEEEAALEAVEAEREETPSVETITVYEKVDLTVEEYAELYGELSQIAREAQRFMVEVTGVTSDVDWFNDVYQNERQTSGVIVANNGVELLILAKDNAVSHYKNIMITFHDGSVIEANKKQADPNTGFCIFGVELNRIPEDTMEDLTVAVLGSSSSTTLLATPVIAIGSPGGTAGSVSYGMITSNTTVVNKLDVNYRLLTTDIYGSTDATGVLIGLNGQVIGIIENSYNADGMKNQISAIGITELKRTIESLSNEKERACLGIYGTDITVALSESMDMPRGVYVKSFEMDSPAMVCGIQSSDIIVGVDDLVINSVSDLAAALVRYKPGDVVTIKLQRKVQDTYREMEVEVTLGTL